ncbi:MAG: formylglycine-generating enzyme family protein [Gammaproteobacteria bacterium]|nr:formylglycine-generating enzyme family protein [Gammaproteobacteria bacterium]
MNRLSGKLLTLIIIYFALTAQLQAETYTSPFGQKMVKIDAGHFIMGTQNFDLLSQEVKPDRLEHLKKELPSHKVLISKQFYLATTEVTQGMWSELMGYKPGKEKRWQREDWKSLPVSRVSWQSVHEFIEVINDLDDIYRYRLPTEAEWEYAARAGSSGLHPFEYGEMAEYAWFKESSGNKPMPVGTLKPNAWGLYDMVGNLWEWVDDSYDPGYYSVSPSIDPPGAEASTRKSMRGGSYHCTPERVRVGVRGSYVEHRSLSTLGFRLAAEKK